MTRALAADPGLEVDSVTRKGKNGDGQDTFFVQAGGGRAAALTLGFPATREQLFAYDALVIANVEGDFFTRAQLKRWRPTSSPSAAAACWCSAAGRSRSAACSARRSRKCCRSSSTIGAAVSCARRCADDLPAHNRLTLTPEGEAHPIMRIGASPDETRKLWSALPALAASAPLGGPRPGATVLAVTTAPGGGVFPVVAVQRYGQGRSMVFAGEASWRWKMMVPSTDRTYEFFWRQAARWLSSAAPDPVVDRRRRTRRSRATPSPSTSTPATRRSRRCPTRRSTRR